MATQPAETQTIDLEFREKLIARVEETVKWAGAPDYDTGMQQAMQIFEVLLSRMSLMRTKEDLRNLFDKMPNPSPLEKKLILAVAQYLPQIFRYGAKQLAEKLEGDAPALPRGRPNVDLERKAEIVAFAGKLHMQGCSLEISKKRAAAKFGISDSTVQRIWDDRGNIDDADFRSALKWLTKEIRNPT
jgi:hypothetical protein